MVASDCWGGDDGVGSDELTIGCATGDVLVEGALDVEPLGTVDGAVDDVDG